MRQRRLAPVKGAVLASAWMALGAGLQGLALAAGNGLEVRARLADEGETQRTLQIGVPIRLEIEARHPPGGVALLPRELDLPSALGERRSRRTHRRALQSGEEIDTYTLELIPFAAGLIEIPSIRLALGSTVAETEPLLVEVDSGLDEAEQSVANSTQSTTLAALENMAAGDPPPEAVRVADPRPGLAVVAAVALALLAVFGRKLWDKRGRLVKAAPAPRPRPAHETALEHLDALAASDLLARSEYNAFFTELSWVLRSYLGERYGFEALERTVDELLEALYGLSTPGLDRNGLARLLAEAEQIKFAKYRPATEDAAEAVLRVREVVERTRYDLVSKEPAKEERVGR